MILVRSQIEDRGDFPPGHDADGSGILALYAKIATYGIRWEIDFIPTYSHLRQRANHHPKIAKDPITCTLRGRIKHIFRSSHSFSFLLSSDQIPTTRTRIYVYVIIKRWRSCANFNTFSLSIDDATHFSHCCITENGAWLGKRHHYQHNSHLHTAQYSRMHSSSYIYDEKYLSCPRILSDDDCFGG